MKSVLYIVGALIELSGIVLVASPDLFPGAIRLAAWARPRLRWIENRLRLVLPLQPRSVVHNEHVSGTIQVSGSASAVASTGASTLEERLAFLLRRDAEAQQHLNRLVERVKGLEDQLSRETGMLGTYVQNEIDYRIVAANRDYQVARIIGVVALAVGLGLSTAGNLIQ